MMPQHANYKIYMRTRVHQEHQCYYELTELRGISQVRSGSTTA